LLIYEEYLGDYIQSYNGNMDYRMKKFKLKKKYMKGQMDNSKKQ